MRFIREQAESLSLLACWGLLEPSNICRYDPYDLASGITGWSKTPLDVCTF